LWVRHWCPRTLKTQVTKEKVDKLFSSTLKTGATQDTFKIMKRSLRVGKSIANYLSKDLYSEYKDVW
jgi:hypothetical protein